MVDELYSNLSLNTSRQVFSQVSGLNIYQNDDAGLQLNVGGEVLIQIGLLILLQDKMVMISADVLGYPESYYTPPETIERMR